jgi:hydroxypyruvate isomerase
MEDADVRLVGLNFFSGDMAGGDRGLASWPASSWEFRDNTEVTVGIGERVGFSALNALYGNRVEQQAELGAENLALAASRVGGTVVVEPVNGADRYPLKSAADVLAVIDRVQQASGVDDLGRPLHLAVNGEDVDAVIAEHAARVAHVQMPTPGPRRARTGDLPLDRQLASLEAAGYGSCVGLEYKPAAMSTASFNWVPCERRTAASSTR